MSFKKVAMSFKKADMSFKKVAMSFKKADMSLKKVCYEPQEGLL